MRAKYYPQPGLTMRFLLKPAAHALCASWHMKMPVCPTPNQQGFPTQEV